MATDSSKKDDPQDDPKSNDDPTPPPVAYVVTQPSHPDNQTQSQSKCHLPDRSNPCCFELRSGVLSVGIFCIVVYFVGLIFSCLLLGVIKFDKQDLSTLDIVTFIVSFLVDLIISIILTVGTVQKNIGWVKGAFGGLIAMFLLDLFVIILQLAQREEILLGEIVGAVLGLIIVVVIKVYMLYVIYAYIRQLNRERQQMTPLGAKGQIPAGPSTPQQSDQPSTEPSQSTTP